MSEIRVVQNQAKATTFRKNQNRMPDELTRQIDSPSIQVVENQAHAAPPREETPLKRVAAYCRVSTDMEQHASSLETQVQSFREMITSRPGWELADVYADMDAPYG